MTPKIFFTIAVSFFVSTCFSQWDVGGMIKNKVEDRVNNGVNEGVDKGLDKGENTVRDGAKNNNSENSSQQPSNAESTSTGNSSSNPPAQENPTTATTLKAYNNYDFVPGEKILFEDDFHDSPDGEFPPRWDLMSGQGVVNAANGDHYMVLTDGNYAKIKPAMKNETYLGNSFTVEFDYYAGDNNNDVLLFLNTTEDNDYGKSISFGTGGEVSTGYFPNDLSGSYKGDADKFKNMWHHAAVAFKDGQIKCYIDQYRVLVVPKCGFVPTATAFGGIAELRFKNVKVANGGSMNMLGKILTDGKVITHAIKFDVNKADIKPESMGFLNQMAEWLKQNPTVKLEIDGHTDSDGDESANMKLSQARATAVKSQLVSMGVSADRLSTKGYGESKPIDNNTTPDGKSNNRRVEFVKA